MNQKNNKKEIDINNEKINELNCNLQKIDKIYNELINTMNKDRQILDEIFYGWKGKEGEKFYQEYYELDEQANNKIQKNFYEFKETIEMEKNKLEQKNNALKNTKKQSEE